MPQALLRLLAVLMGDFGSDLKMEREKSGISLEQIAQSTKVSVRHLRALEDQRFDLLPGGIFNRGILRGYLRYLNLDEDPWIARFASVYQPAATDKEHENEWLSYAEKATGVKPSPAGADQLRFRWIGIVLLLLILAIVGWFVLRFVRHRAARTPAAAVNSRYFLPTPFMPRTSPFNPPYPHSLQSHICCFLALLT